MSEQIENQRLEIEFGESLPELQLLFNTLRLRSTAI